jgi:WhiB family transcriptional regulator, redox-sensing transcriptional regulator
VIDGVVKAVGVGGGQISLEVSLLAPEWAQQIDEPTPCFQTHPDLFFPDSYGLSHHHEISEARALCRECPVRLACLAWAVERTDLEGIWAGTTPMERRRLRTGKAVA